MSVSRCARWSTHRTLRRLKVLHALHTVGRLDAEGDATKYPGIFVTFRIDGGF
jgi:hypothetical protein